METIYQEHGYKDRNDYFHSLADIHGVNVSVVISLSSLLGPDEDFDGLVSALDDLESEGWEE